MLLRFSTREILDVFAYIKPHILEASGFDWNRSSIVKYNIEARRVLVSAIRDVIRKTNEMFYFNAISRNKIESRDGRWVLSRHPGCQ